MEEDILLYEGTLKELNVGGCQYQKKSEHAFLQRNYPNSERFPKKKITKRTFKGGIGRGC